MNDVKQKSKVLNIALWTAQMILSISMVWAAYMKLFEDPGKLAAMWPWTANNRGLVKFTGVIDLAAALGLVLPMWLRIQPRLTVFAAYGTTLLMIAASVFHISRGEASLIGINVFFFAAALFIAIGRQKQF